MTAKRDNRGKKTPQNKTSDDDIRHIENFIKELPAVPSHYCRSSTSKKYLPVESKNISAVYRGYKIQCESSNPQKIPVSETVFRNVFTTKFNIGFHTPKKDKCSICESMKNIGQDNLSEVQKDKFDKHIHNAELSKSVHLAAQDKSKTDSSFLCTSFDLQKILNTPHGDSMLLFYSRKYTMFNETFYESGTQNGYCFIWGEQDGMRGSNEICTTIDKYLTIVEDRKTVKTLTLFCDSCPGQNKNNVVFAAIFWFMNKKANNINKVSITYLQPGHTYMPVDSVHSTIESNLKKKIVWAPSEWPTIIVNSRNKPKPYEVFSLNHTHFMDYKQLQIAMFPKLTKTDDGQKIKVNEIKIVSFFKKSSTITLQFSYDLDSEKKQVTIQQPKQRRGSKGNNYKTLELQPAFNNKLPISVAKYNDLIKLCNSGVIPNRYHKEFKSLKRNENVDDVLGD